MHNGYKQIEAYDLSRRDNMLVENALSHHLPVPYGTECGQPINHIPSLRDGGRRRRVSSSTNILSLRDKKPLPVIYFTLLSIVFIKFSIYL
jgi:hypothetical protein